MPDSEVFFTILKVAGLFIGLSFIVFWVGLVWWVSQDILTRTSDKIIIAAAVAMTAILGPVGVMFYLIIRPKQTLKESYGEMMEHEMMLRAAASTICPMCEHMSQEDFVNCPYCGTVLKKQCQGCQKLVAMDWHYCPYCGTVSDDAPVSRPAKTIEPTALQELRQEQQVEALKQDAMSKIRLEEAQKATFATDSPINNGTKKKFSQAGQSALDLLKQAFTVPSTPTSSSDPISEPQPSLEPQPQADQGNQSSEIKSETPKKRATKKRSNKRAKK